MSNMRASKKVVSSADSPNESRDIVFAPYLVVSPRFGEVYQSFMRSKGRKRLSGWTCKKTAMPGDLYLFYFGQSECKIAGFAVCSESPDPAGEQERGSTNRQRMFFCAFERLHHFKEPISVDELQATGAIAEWWQTRPYRGRPKTIPSEAAASLLKLIAKREPKTADFLAEYIGECVSSVSDTKRSFQRDALEGTIYERLARQPVRSKALREAKIREVFSKHGRLVCEVPNCRFNFLAVYGEVGRGFAHVHHRHSLAGGGKRRSKPSDLAIVCANCHAMIHRWGNCRSLRNLIS